MVKGSSRGPLRLVSALVLLVLVAMTVAASLGVRSVVNAEERRLLHARAAEAGALIGISFQGVAATLPVLGVIDRPRPGATEQFTSAARLMLGHARAIGALQVSRGTVSVVASVGDGPAAGGTLPADRATLARRATSAHGMTAGVLNQSGGRILSFAVPAGAGLVLFEDLPLTDDESTQNANSGPFSELQGALYASTRPDPPPWCWPRRDSCRFPEQSTAS